MVTIVLSDRVSPSAGFTEITRALQQAIDEAGKSGSVVVVPPGRWTIATIDLRSNMTLHIARGATLLAHTEIADYPARPAGHNKDRQPYHLLVADGCEHLTIEGEGTINGQGQAFWNPPLGDRSQGAAGLFWREKKTRVTPMLELRNCRDLRLRDFTLKGSPGWTLHANCCDQVRINGVTVDNHLFGPNTDGFDINGCRDVWISDCELRCGDDAIILKATQDARSCERVVVTNCILQSNCAALGLGAETTHGIRDVAFSNCVVRSALRMIQIEMWETGTIENVVFSNITGRTMSDVPLERPIYMDIQHHGRTDGELGQMRNIVVAGLTAETRGRIVMTAADGAAIENVTLRDIHLRWPEIEDPELTVNQMRSQQMSNSNPHTRAARAAVVADNVHGLRIENLRLQWPDENASPDENPNGVFPGIHGTLPMHAMLFRNVRDAIIDTRAAPPSQGGVEPIVQSGSEIRLVE